MPIFADRFEDFQPKNKRDSIYKEIYRFGLRPSVSISSVESRNSKYIVRRAKIASRKTYIVHSAYF